MGARPGMVTGPLHWMWQLTRTQIAMSLAGPAPQESEATVIADLLGLQSTAVQPMPATPPVADTTAANVLVLAGQDLARALPAPATTTTVRRAATGSTTTTARKVTSTTVHTATTAHTTTTTR